MRKPESCYPLWLRLTPLLPLALGTLLSFTYADAAHAIAESGRAALSLLHLGYIGNPYALPSGPTAHVSPISSALLALVFGLFGDNSRDARIALSLFCTVSYAAGAWLVLRICQEQRIPVIATLPGVILTSVIPIYLYHVVIIYRFWDQPLGALLLCGALFVLLRGLRSDRSAHWTIAALAFLAGVGNLTSPVIMPPIVVGIAILIYSARHRIAVIPASLLAIAILAACIAPWAIRNEMLLGKPIIARSNFGLELAVGNQDGMTPDNPIDHGLPIHPYLSEDAARRLIQVGEVRYMSDMFQLGATWIETHPGAALKLVGERLVLSFFPSRDMVEWIPVFHGAVWYGFLLFGALTVAGLARVLVTGPMRLLWLAFTVLPLAPYVITHVQLRYSYIAFFPSIALISVGLFGHSALRDASEDDR